MPLLAGALLAAAPAAGLATTTRARPRMSAARSRRARSSRSPKSSPPCAASCRARLPASKSSTKHGRWLYEFRVVDSKGRLFEVYVDARSGEIDEVKEK